MPKQETFTDAIRRAVLTAPMSRYEIAKRLGVSQGTLADFVHGNHGIGSELLDELARLLKLRVVVDGRRGKRRR